MAESRRYLVIVTVRDPYAPKGSAPQYYRESIVARSAADAARFAKARHTSGGTRLKVSTRVVE